MKKEEKRLILILVAITVIVIIAAIIITQNNGKKNSDGAAQNTENVVDPYVQTLDDGSRLNVSEELQKTKTLDGLEITNIQFKEIGGVTRLLADVENKTGAQTTEKEVKITVLDKEGKTITEVSGMIDSIAAGSKVQLNIAASADVVSAYDFKIENK